MKPCSYILAKHISSGIGVWSGTPTWAQTICIVKGKTKQKATTTTTATKISPTNALGTGLSSTLTIINYVCSILPGAHSAELLRLGYPTACLHWKLYIM